MKRSEKYLCCVEGGFRERATAKPGVRYRKVFTRGLSDQRHSSEREWPGGTHQNGGLGNSHMVSSDGGVKCKRKRGFGMRLER